MQLTTSNPEAARQIKEDSERVLKTLPGVRHVHVEVRQPAAGQAAPTGALANQNRIPGVKRVIAVASGKGGVGKSTCSVNLACALKQLGARVGLLDCDIYGPSIPLMMGVHERPTVSEDERLVPPSNHGVKVMSIGLLLDERPAGDLARADDHENDPAIPDRGGMGRDWISCSWICRRARATRNSRSAKPCRWTAASS